MVAELGFAGRVKSTKPTPISSSKRNDEQEWNSSQYRSFLRLSCIAAGSVIQWPDENAYCATSRGVGG